MVTVLEDFEDGVGDWTDNGGDTWEQDGTYAIEESYSGHQDDSGGSWDNHVIVPDTLSGGAQPSTLTVYWYETSNSNGSALSLYNSSGNRVLSAGTGNPQWTVEDAGGESEFYSGGGTDRWIRYDFDFDWGAGSYTLTGEDLSANKTESTSGDFINGGDIETIATGFPDWAGNRAQWWLDDIHAEGLIPAAPSNLSASASGDDIDLSWTDNSDDEDGFNIYRAQSSGSSLSDYTKVASVGADQTTYTDSNLPDGERVYYRVTAYAGGESDPSNEDAATTDLPAPSGVSLSIDSPTDGSATWTDESDNEGNYRVEIEEDGSWSHETDTSANSESASVSVAESSDELRVRVRAETEHTESDWMYSETVSTNVTGLTVEDERDTGIDLSFSDVDQEDEVELYRAESSGSTISEYSLIGSVSDGSNTFTDTDRENGEQYYYRAAAVYGGETGALSGEVSGTTTLPDATWEGIDDTVEGELTLDWSKEDTSSDGDWEILRSTDGSTGSVVATISDLSQTSWTDTGRDDGEKYYYIVRRTTDHASSDSDQNSAVALLPAPTDLEETDHDATTISIAWTDTHDNGTTAVEYKPTDESEWTESETVERGTEAATIDGLRTGEKYDVRVLATTEHTQTEDN